MVRAPFIGLSGLALAGWLCATPACAQTVSNSADLPDPGQLRLKLQGVQERAGSARRSALPYEVQLGLTKEWGVYLDGDAYVWQRDASGVTTKGGGDAGLALRRLWTVSDDAANAVQFGTHLPAAAQGLGNGSDKTDYTLTGLVSRSYGKLHMDLNAYATRLGAVDAGVSRKLFGVAAAFSVSWSKHWGAVAEVSATRQHGIQHGRQLLYALTYAPNAKIDIEAGLARADRPAPANKSGYVSVTFPVAQLW
ncbi:MAG TPA: transporter [Rhizobacter sp.]|nr:transporter [Rhizobacter sp.]